MVVQKQRRPGDQVFWPKVVLKKWLNLRSKDAEFNADEDEDDGGGEVDDGQENCGCDGGGEAERRGDAGAGVEITDESPYRLRRRNSETLRAQYIDTKELRIFIGTYNAAGKAPPEGLDIAAWLDAGGEPADIYVLGFQEVVPLNAGNVFGAEDGRPAVAWEELIRDTLKRAQPSRPKYRYRSHPATPSRFVGPSDDHSDELSAGGADTEDDDDTPFSFPAVQPDQHVAATPRKLATLDDHYGAMDDDDPEDQQDEEQQQQQQRTLLKTMSKTDRIGLAWPEKPLSLLAKHAMSTTSFRGSRLAGDQRDDDPAMVPDLDLGLGLDAAARGKRCRSPFVRIVSKQMVGIFLTIWVRRGLRKCVQYLKVSTVGVGAMGYIGNKVGSPSSSSSSRNQPLPFFFSRASDVAIAAGSSVGEHVDIPDDVLLRVQPPVGRREARRPPQAERRRAGDPPADALRRRPRAAQRHHPRPRENFLARRSQLPHRRAVREGARSGLRHGLAPACRERSAEAGAEEGEGVRWVERGGAGVRADVQVRGRDGEVHRRRPEGRAEDTGVVRPGAVVREGGEAAAVRQVGAGAVGPPPRGGHLRRRGGGVPREEAAEGAHAHRRRGGRRRPRRRRVGPRLTLTWQWTRHHGKLHPHATMEFSFIRFF